jgi:hypothetical protein
LNILDVEDPIYEYCRDRCNYEKYHESVRLIHKSLFRIFIENGSVLKTFEAELQEMTDNNGLSCINDIIELILQNPNFICNIRNLKIYFYYICNDANVSKLNSLLSLLSSNCNLLTLKLKVDDDRLIKNTSRIINTQQNLQKISFDVYTILNLSILFKNFNTTLKTITFYEIDFRVVDMNIFEQLNVLESIHIFL